MKTRAAAQVQTPQFSGRFAPSFTPLFVLQACHGAALTGVLRARSGPQLVTVSFRRGEIVAADALDGEGIDTLVSFSEWTSGQFDFVSGAPLEGRPIDGPFNWLMLEVCRRSDEARAAAERTAS